MRKIFIQEPDSDIWEKWIRDCQEETQKVIGAFDRGEKPIISDLYKRKAIKNTYFASKDAPFYGRCAYCETPIADTQSIDIEHFRPKAGIKDENGNVMNLKDLSGVETDIPHHGYYWLAYDWRNLLPSCEKCNRPKSTIFPVIGNHAQSVGEEVNEIPLLINPISELDEDNPENHLAVDSETGVMYSLNGSVRGEMCLKIFKLNERGQLVQERRTQQRSTQLMIIELQNAFKELANPTNSEKQTYKTLIDCCQELIGIFEGKHSYTMASLCVLRKNGFSSEWLEKKSKMFHDLLSKIGSQ
ncbi:MAG: hypothetical protein LH649_02300 [Pseudanabaena sp. CAN_BIN31]|nr:hypothetical protein [Pseudanabaena sp. CAN_BIN31]